MSPRSNYFAGALAWALCALAAVRATVATGVPIGGFLPMVGVALTDEFNDDFDTFAIPSGQPGGMMLGSGGMPHYDVALVDTGAAVSVLTAQAHVDFMMNGPYPGEQDGFRGTETIQIGGATGTLFADINDPLGLYVAGLQNRTSTIPLILSHNALEGQTNTSLITIPAESDLPNVVGLTFASQYATSIRSDLPQIFELNGRTVRTPHIEFLPLGSGGQGITRRAPMSLNPGSSFTQPPFWFYNLEEFDIDNPHENPSQPTVIQGAMFLNVNVQNEGQQLNNFQFFFDTGADVTVVSELNASRLGFDPVLDEPEFTVAVVGSGGTNFEVPGFFVDQFTIQALGGNVTLSNVPVVVLDVTNPADPGNIVDGIVGTNLLAGRNVVIDPNPSTGGGGIGPSLYISDPITTQKNWTATTPVGDFGAGAHWNGGTPPVNLSITNVRHVAGPNQRADVAVDTNVWEMNVSGTPTQTMTVRVQPDVTLTTFSGVNIEQGGVIELQNSNLDGQFVEIIGGTLRGAGTITTGSGPIPGQVEIRNGTVQVGDGVGNGIGTLEIIGRFASGDDGTLAFHVGGLTAGTQYDQLIVDGGAAFGGTLDVTLANLGTFTPVVGNSFTLITATDGISGTFDNLILPSAFQWNVAYGENDVVLSVTALGLAGDFNGDGSVDAADYVVWRKNGGTPAEYQTWRSNFGRTAASATSASISANNAPEPASWMVCCLAAVTFACVIRQRRLFCLGPLGAQRR